MGSGVSLSAASNSFLTGSKMFKLNQFGFPVFEIPESLKEKLKPENMAKEILSVQPMDKIMDPGLFKKMFIDPVFNREDEYEQDFNLEKGDVVDFLDAEGCYFCKATVVGVRDDNALVELEMMPQKTIVVRRSDLLKLVRKNK